jgi:S-(hydroxymethyl)glutathione dehydrogenase/alcohol dehydrogenase
MMKAAVCYEYAKPLVIEDIDMAKPKKGEVRVRLAATAICHSDIHDIRGELPARLPCVAGHESAGYVDEVGPDVKNVKVGDPVVVTLLQSCGTCFYCITGLPHLCEARFSRKPPEVRISNKKGQPLAQGGGVGGFAQYVLVNESQLVKVPKEMPLDQVALLACGVITGFGAVVNRAKVKPFQSVIVIGTGGVGINAIQGAAYSGAYPIIAVDVLDAKMKTAMDFGATHTVNAKRDDAVDAVRKLTSGRGADYVFITVGSVAAIRQGLSMSGPRGTTVVIGLPPMKDMLTISPMELIGAEKSLTGGYMGSTNLQVDIPHLITLYQTGRLKLAEIITGRYPLERINEAIESTLKGEALRNVIMF